MQFGEFPLLLAVMCSRVYEWSPSKCRASVEISGFGFKFRKRWLELEEFGWAFCRLKKNYEPRARAPSLERNFPFLTAFDIPDEPVSLPSFLPQEAVPPPLPPCRARGRTLVRPRSVEALCRRSMERRRLEEVGGGTSPPPRRPRAFVKRREAARRLSRLDSPQDSVLDSWLEDEWQWFEARRRAASASPCRGHGLLQLVPRHTERIHDEPNTSDLGSSEGSTENESPLHFEKVCG
ncbi:uncharacterized protein LOC132203955 [Neocloeon triangulifer]|uniref:uncharacterized protein LOC132203955 n=1 Tax=Neocloeon triangulifer TaxID=2078957 RepID=UPI00286ED721|nr:uncharacterized protein LOC132203955 [Neocloeon triangulifer]